MKKYNHKESIYFIMDENKNPFAVIGYSAINHDDEINATFATFKAYYKPRWSSEYRLLQSGEIRWDGMITAEQEFNIHHKQIDDLLAKIIVEFLVYDIADNQVFTRHFRMHSNRESLYYILKQYSKEAPPIIDIVNAYDNSAKSSYILEQHPQLRTICDTLLCNLTEMSTKAISTYNEKNG